MLPAILTPRPPWDREWRNGVTVKKRKKNTDESGEKRLLNSGTTVILICRGGNRKLAKRSKKRGSQTSREVRILNSYKRETYRNMLGSYLSSPLPKRGKERRKRGTKVAGGGKRLRTFTTS